MLISGTTSNRTTNVPNCCILPLLPPRPIYGHWDSLNSTRNVGFHKGNIHVMRFTRTFVQIFFLCKTILDHSCTFLAYIWSTREGDSIANVLHSRCEQYHSLKPKTESSVRARAIFPQIEVPAEVFLLQAKLFDSRRKNVKSLFPLASSNQLANLLEIRGYRVEHSANH